MTKMKKKDEKERIREGREGGRKERERERWRKERDAKSLHDF